MHFSRSDRQLGTAEKMLGSCLAGREGGAFLVDGTVASGKTELLRKMTNSALERGAVVLSAVGGRAENEIPLGVVDQLTHNASAQLDEVVELRDTVEAGASATSTGRIDSEFLDPARGRLFARLHGAAMRLAEQAPLVIAVDDLHHADPISLQFLSYLSRRIANKQVLLVFSLLPGAVPTLPLFQTEMSSHPNFRRVMLQPLSVGQVGELLRQTSELADAARLAPLYHDLTGGNPRLVKALVADRMGTADGPGTDGLTHYRRAVLTCLHRMDQVSGKVAQALSVLDETESRHLIDRLLHLDRALVRRSEHILRRSGLLGRQGYRHGEARAAVRDEYLAPEQRARMHTEAARLLFQDGAQAAEVGTHLLAADRAADPWAVPLLIEAAEQHLREQRVDRATPYIRLAQREAASEQDQAAVSLMLARTEWPFNPAAVARHLGSRTGLAADPSQQAARMIGSLLSQGLVDQASEALRWISESGFDTEHADSDDWVAFRTWLGYTYPPLAPHLSAAAPRAVGGPSGSRPPAGELASSVHLLGCVLRGDLAGAALDLAEDRLRRLPLSEKTLQPLGITLRALVYADQYGTASDWGETLFSAVNHRNRPSWRYLLATIMAEVALGRGELAAAVEYARTALTCRADLAGLKASGQPLALLVLALVKSGDLTGARQLLPQLTADAPRDGRDGLYLLHARGHYHLANQQPDLALRDFDVCGQRMLAWGLVSASFIPWRTDRAQALLALHRREEARDLAGDQLAGLHPLQGRTRAMTLRVLAETMEPGYRSVLLREAQAVMTAAPDQVELGRIHGLLVEAERTPAGTGSRLPPAGDDAGTTRPASTTGSDGATRPDRAPQDGSGAIAELTAAERRVALLVGRGRTNSEAASELYITISTVEQHLTRIYRKLGIKQRSDLRACLLGSG
ncbi:AAA family ATPase [Frankia sp. AiPs1]|uniref:helix-turn-helix transcriptional regulator n=1 Tax=Frankia sp. AiPs1 TaxID=573493 RepID=UPI0020438010|nr:LuxR family transcriptional regulator [Frankia sp. AiPs1]MCM3923114.1 AAA family ATPase [Frankia sp. AiPs1]